MTICSAYPIENYNRGWGAIQILLVPCSPLIEVALYIARYGRLVLRAVVLNREIIESNA